jgi:hypothetical protein
MDTLYILTAAVFAQGAHTYLLYSQRHERKWSLSRHAIVTPKSRLVYRIGSFLSGAAMLAATNLMFDQPSTRFIFHIAIVTVILQWLQAIVLKDAEKIMSIHAFFAYFMWVEYILITGLSVFYLPTTSLQQWTAGLLALATTIVFLYMSLHRHGIWWLQYLSVYGFNIALLVLSL